MMGDISRDSDSTELHGAPAFAYGDRVRSRRMVRNDGTFPGREIGDVLVRKGDIGYVTSIGTFLQRFYIDHGYCVGMKGRELEPLPWSEQVDATPSSSGSTP